MITWDIKSPNEYVARNQIFTSSEKPILNIYNTSTSGIVSYYDGIVLSKGKYVCFINRDIPSQDYFLSFNLRSRSSSIQYNMIHYFSGNAVIELTAATKLYLQIESGFPQQKIVTDQMSAAIMHIG